jgi:hypothetical protein
VNYINVIEIIEELKSIHPNFDEELNLAMKAIENIYKSMRYNGVIE